MDHFFPLDFDARSKCEIRSVSYVKPTLMIECNTILDSPYMSIATTV